MHPSRDVPGQIILPLKCELCLFTAVAFLAGRDEIGPGAPAASGKWHQVIHGQVASAHCSATVMALARGALPSPPACLSELASLAAFNAYFFFG